MSETERRRTRQSRNKQKNRVVRILAAVGMGVLAVLIIAGLALPSFGPGGSAGVDDFLDRGGFLARPVDGPGVEVVDQGRLHFASLSDRADPGFYISSPATSGTHSPTWERCGIFTDSVPDELLVHNLEHGFVNIHYNSDDAAFVGQLEAAARGLPNWPNYYIFAPYPDMQQTVALTAWNRVLYLDGVDEDAMREFADAYQARGPEVARGCDSPGVMAQGVPDPVATPEGGVEVPEGGVDAPEISVDLTEIEPGDSADEGAEGAGDDDGSDASGEATPEPDPAATPDAG